jgi:hypothetical protein
MPFFVCLLSQALNEALCPVTARYCLQMNAPLPGEEANHDDPAHAMLLSAHAVIAA